jgi:hypothetical protein
MKAFVIVMSLVCLNDICVQVWRIVTGNTARGSGELGWSVVINVGFVGWAMYLLGSA